MMSDHVSKISFNSVFYFRFYQSLYIRLPSQSPRQCSQKRLLICANFGGLACADLGNVVLELVEDLDLEVICG
jgi:hypothetical protein